MMPSEDPKMLPGARVFKTARRSRAPRDERRVRRSPSPRRAMGLWMDACEARFGLDMLVLAGPGGLRMTSRPSLEGDVLAAYAPLLIAADPAAAARLRQQLTRDLPSLTGKLLRVSALTLRGQRCFLCCVGARPGVLRTAIDFAEGGIERILDRR